MLHKHLTMDFTLDDCKDTSDRMQNSQINLDDATDVIFVICKTKSVSLLFVEFICRFVYNKPMYLLLSTYNYW